MTTFCISIPDAIAARVTDAFAARHGYEEQVAGPNGTTVPNPVTKAAFLKATVTTYIRESARQGMIAQATQDAGSKASDDATRDMSW